MIRIIVMTGVLIGRRHQVPVEVDGTRGVRILHGILTVHDQDGRLGVRNTAS